MRYFAGIDGGQSGTAAVIADESGRVLGRGAAQAADEVGADAQSTRLRDALAGALEAARERAGLPSGTRFSCILAGISGFDGRVYGRPVELRADCVLLEHDAPVAHAGALAGMPGIVVIAGTGSVAFGDNGNGQRLFIGGWGYLFGDEGSAFGIARDALAESMHDADAGLHAELEAAALQHFEAASLRTIARAFYAGSISRTHIASFARIVVTHSSKHPGGMAARCVSKHVDALVHLAAQAIERCNMPRARVAFTGGLFHSGMIRDRIAAAMRERLPDAQLVPPAYDPAVGALLLAYKAAGIAVDGVYE